MLEEVNQVAKQAILAIRPSLSNSDLVLSQFSYSLSLKTGNSENDIIDLSKESSNGRYILSYYIIPTVTGASDLQDRRPHPERIPYGIFYQKALVIIDNTKREVSSLQFTNASGHDRLKEIMDDTKYDTVSKELQMELTLAVFREYLDKPRRDRQYKYYLAVHGKDINQGLISALNDEGYNADFASNYKPKEGSKFNIESTVLLEDGTIMITYRTYSYGGASGNTLKLEKKNGEWKITEEGSKWIACG